MEEALSYRELDYISVSGGLQGARVGGLLPGHVLTGAVLGRGEVSAQGAEGGGLWLCGRASPWCAEGPGPHPRWPLQWKELGPFSAWDPGESLPTDPGRPKWKGSRDWLFWQVGLDQQTVTLVCTNRRRQFLLDSADATLTE